MDKPPFGYYLRKRFYSPRRWWKYLSTLDWSTPAPPEPQYTIVPMTEEEIERKHWEAAKEDWLADQVSDYAFMTYQTHKDRELEHKRRLLMAQPFRDD